MSFHTCFRLVKLWGFIFLAETEENKTDKYSKYTTLGSGKITGEVEQRVISTQSQGSITQCAVNQSIQNGEAMCCKG